MSEKLTHWRKGFNPEYLGAYSLAPEYKDIIVTIKNVRQDVEVIDQNGKKSPCTVCYFVENIKPMILNVTNSKVLVKLAKSEFIEKWSGLKIQIFVARVKFAKDMVEALRIRDFIPTTELPELLPNTETWQNGLHHMRNGVTIEQVLKKYRLSAENKALFLKEYTDSLTEQNNEEVKDNE